MTKLAFLVMLVAPTLSFAAGDIELDDASIDLDNTDSLERGAKYYVDHCQGCHSAKHMRYARIAKDFDLTEEQVERGLIITGGKIHDTMTSAMNREDGEKWFGVSPPDLSVIARSRGADWLYTYLRSFYMDEDRPFGSNNSVFQDVAMPNVLWELQGHQKAIYKTKDKTTGIERLELVQAGSMTPEQFDEAMNDLVNFLVYVGEPTQIERVRLGKYVILFLLVFLALAYLLKKEYWKDVH